jgi:hypothetical protein
MRPQRLGAAENSSNAEGQSPASVQGRLPWRGLASIATLQDELLQTLPFDGLRRSPVSKDLGLDSW